MQYSDLTRDELEAEAERLKALLEKRYDDTELVSFVGGEINLQGSIVEYLAAFMAQALKNPAAPDVAPCANYVEIAVSHAKLGPLTLTLQRQRGATPHSMRKEAEAERDGLIEALHDAITRPKGVVPVSAERWYSPQRAGQAEQDGSGK